MASKPSIARKLSQRIWKNNQPVDWNLTRLTRHWNRHDRKINSKDYRNGFIFTQDFLSEECSVPHNLTYLSPSFCFIFFITISFLFSPKPSLNQPSSGSYSSSLIPPYPLTSAPPTFPFRTGWPPAPFSFSIMASCLFFSSSSPLRPSLQLLPLPPPLPESASALYENLRLMSLPSGKPLHFAMGIPVELK